MHKQHASPYYASLHTGYLLKTPISLISHDIQFFNRRLRKGQYFFSDIKKEGILLHDSGAFELAEAKELSSPERKRIAGLTWTPMLIHKANLA